MKTYLTAGLSLLLALNSTMALALENPTAKEAAGSQTKTNDPADSALHKADAIMESGRLDKAIAAYQDVIRQFPDSSRAHSRLGAALAVKGDIDEGRGDKAAAQNDYDTAILEERAAIKADPKAAFPHIILGQIFANQKKMPEAIAEFNEALKLKPNMYTAHLDLGIAYLHAGELDNSIAAFKKAKDIRPEDPVPHINLSLLVDQKGNHKEAIEEALEGIKVDTQKRYLHDSYVNLGNIYLDAKDLDNAKDYFDKALRIAKNHPNALSGLGWVLAEKGFADEGMKKQRQALAVQPSFVPAHTRLGLILAGQKKTAEAEAEFKKALEINPKDITAHTEYGKFLKEQNRKDEAKAQFKKALDVNPHFKPAADGLATLDGTK